MAKTNFATIDEYQAGLPPETVMRLQQVRRIIHQVVPDVEESISYQIPCFRYKGYLVHYAAFASHITLSHPFSPALLKYFKKDLEHYKVSKAAIQFPHAEKLPIALIKRLVTYRKKENENIAQKTRTPKERNS